MNTVNDIPLRLPLRTVMTHSTNVIPLYAAKAVFKRMGRAFIEDYYDVERGIHKRYVWMLKLDGRVLVEQAVGDDNAVAQRVSDVFSDCLDDLFMDTTTTGALT